MALTGKLFGAGLGFLMGGPIGAVLGGIIGHFVKDMPLEEALRPRLSEDPEIRRQQEELFFVANLVGILTAMLKADGEVRQEEVATIRRFFSERLGYTGESLEVVRTLIKQSLETELNIDVLCAHFKARSDYATRLLLMECLDDVAMADGKLHPAEEQMLNRISQLLGVERADRDRTRAHGGSEQGAGYSARASRSDYEILGLSPGATPDEVKRAYRELVKKYHPDRVAHLGDEFKELAHEKFIEIQKAYDRLSS